MDISLLTKLGMTDKEIRVYLALLSLGKTKSGQVVKKTGIPSSKIYHILNSLIEKGLVGYIIQGKVKWFHASKPAALRHLIDVKEEEVTQTRKELENIMPSLEAEFAAEKRDQYVEILEGLRGIKSLYEHSLQLCSEGETMYTVGYPVLASQLLNAYFKDYHKRLVKRGLRAKILYDYDAWFVKKREPRPYAEQRYLPKGIHTPAFIHIFRDFVGIMVVTEKQKTCIVIKNKEVAESYMQYFNLLWKFGKRTG